MIALFLLSFFVPVSRADEVVSSWGVYGWSEKGNQSRIFLALRNNSVVYPSLHLFIYTDSPRNFTITVNSDVVRTRVNFSSEHVFKLRPGRNLVKVSDGHRSVSYSVISSSDIRNYVGPPSKKEQELITKSYLYSEINAQAALILLAGAAGVVYGYWRAYTRKMEDMEQIA